MEMAPEARGTEALSQIRLVGQSTNRSPLHWKRHRSSPIKLVMSAASRYKAFCISHDRYSVP